MKWIDVASRLWDAWNRYEEEEELMDDQEIDRVRCLIF
jgi:hypothetical protein